MINWEPIETAPKVGNAILLFSPDRWVKIGYYGMGEWGDKNEFYPDVTHWSELNDPNL